MAGRLGGEAYGVLLVDLADRAELEGTRLLEMVRAQRRRLPER